MLHSVSRLFILANNDKIIVKGLHSAFAEPLRSVLFNTFNVNVEENSQWQLQFTAYDDGSISFNMLSVEASIWWQGQQYIIKQFKPNYSNGFTTYQVTAIHVAYEISRIRQRNVKTGTLTYSVNDVLSFYLKGNSLGFTWQVIGKFGKDQITDLGNGSGKDMLDKIVSTWPDAIFYPDNKNIRIYQHDVLAKNLHNRIDYQHNSPEMKLVYDSTGIVNQIKVSGKIKENTDSDKTEYYFEPFLVTDQKSVTEWGLHPGDDLSDERFTDKDAMKNYAISQLMPQPTLSIEVTELDNEIPSLLEIRRLENRKANFVTNVEVVAFTYYPLDQAQATSITLNNRMKTILNYKSSQNKSLRDALKAQSKRLNNAAVQAKKAYDSRLIGELITTETKNSVAIEKQTNTSELPLYALKMATDDNDFGLPKGAKIAVQTNVDGVEGLDARITAGQKKYSDATQTQSGLMSASDKVKLDDIRKATQVHSGLMSDVDKIKLDNIQQEPVSSIKISDSSTGVIYKLIVSNGEIKLTGV